MISMDKIFTGMESGPESIEKNFNQLAKSEIRDTGWINITNKATTTLSVGFIHIRRIGPLVLLAGYVKPPAGSNLNVNDSYSGDIMTMPDGFKPDRDVHRESTQGTASKNYSAKLYIESNVMKLINTSGYWSTWLDNIIYTTSDDFPTLPLS